jgi:uncharacterized protein YbbC (DUF1343 family)
MDKGFFMSTSCFRLCVLWCVAASCLLFGRVELGIDRLFQPGSMSIVEGKKVGLITNQTGVNGHLERTLDLFEKQHEEGKLTLLCVFAPEHGLTGEEYAGDNVANQKTEKGIPIYSLYGATRRPTKEMLKGLDVIVYDIQDIGCRSYTYASTLFYVMEEASKKGIEVVVLDRPNPLGGKIADGPMLDERCRSFVGYINVPYCHGMTIGELARFFNEEYKVGCTLTVVPMKGWARGMRFEMTGLAWIPTSPNIPEPSTPFFYPATGILGELQLVATGVGYSLPFKVVVATWIDRKKLAKKLNQGCPEGVHFQETRIKPFSGKNASKTCEGVLIIVTDWSRFNPIRVQYWLFDVLKQMYPKQFREALLGLGKQLEFFHLVCGTRAVYEILLKEEKLYEKLIALQAEERYAFLKLRQKYLNPLYADS